ncbi:glutamate--tRNA ligase, partial [Desulfovibrio sp. 1188_IL3213]
GKLPQERLEPLCAMFRERANNLKALAESFRPLLVTAAELEFAEKDAAKHLTEAGKAHLTALAAVFAACEPFAAESLEAALNAYVADNGLKFKEVAPPLRTALMGFMGGSHLNEIMAFLGRDETLARLKKAAG